MFPIDNLTSDAKQKQTLVLPDATQIIIQIEYYPQQFGWFITSLTYLDFVLTGVRITNSPDILYQFKNKLPFGLACFTQANREPTQQDDFLSGASQLFILTQAEVQAYAEFLSG